MKKSIAIMLVLCTLLAVLSLGVLPISAIQIGSIGNCTWTLEGTVLTIGGNGGTGSTSNAPWGQSVTRLIIKPGVTAISESLFQSFPRLTEIVVEKGSQHFKAVDGVLFDKNMTKLIHYPAQKGGRSYTVPSTVKTLGNEAFYGNARLVDISLPQELERVGLNTFYGSVCFALGSQNGVVYVDNCLVKVTNQKLKELKVREGTKVIADGALAAAWGLEDVILPEGLRTIGDNAFSWCNNLMYISFPYSVNYIGNSAFYDCTSLELIFYRGSQSDEADMYVDANGNIDLLSAEWIYNACYESDDHTWGDYYVTKEATCKKSGMTEHACEICHTREAEVIPPRHKFSNDLAVVTKTPSLVRSGERICLCEGCGMQKTETIDRLTLDEEVRMPLAIVAFILLVMS